MYSTAEMTCSNLTDNQNVYFLSTTYSTLVSE